MLTIIWAGIGLWATLRLGLTRKLKPDALFLLETPVQGLLTDTWSIWILLCRWQWSSWCWLQLWSRGWTGQPWRRRRRPPGAASRRRSRRADTCQEGRASSQLGRLFTRSSRRSRPMALSPEGQQAQGKAQDQWAVPGKAQVPDRARALEGGQDLG